MKKDNIAGGIILLLLVVIFASCVNSTENKISSDNTTEQNIDIILKNYENNGYKVLEKLVTPRPGGLNDEEKVVYIALKAKSWNMTHIKTCELGEELSKLSEVYQFGIRWEGDGVDKFGNDTQVFLNTFSFEHDTFKKINWKQVNADNLAKIADNYTESSSFKTGQNK